MRQMICVLLAALGASVTAAPPSARPGWALVWSDEFDRDGAPDPARWGYERGFVRNGERQYYTTDRRENARVENGLLVIEARAESFGKADVTSASLTTQGRAAWTYGRIEVRAQVPHLRGSWPAIWLLGTNIPAVGWPRCGEIDIMEHVGFDPTHIHANLHTAAFNHTKRNGRGAKLAVADATRAFHVYALDWRPDRIDVFVDDQKYLTVIREPGHGPAEWPFDQPFYLILNLAIGGAWGGQQGVDLAGLPVRFLLDYVRVYREQPPAPAGPP